MRERYDEIRGQGIELLALAPGSLDQTGAFAAAHALPFPLLADPQLAVYRTYQVESRLRSLGQRPPCTRSTETASSATPSSEASNGNSATSTKHLPPLPTVLGRVRKVVRGWLGARPGQRGNGGERRDRRGDAEQVSRHPPPIGNEVAANTSPLKPTATSESVAIRMARRSVNRSAPCAPAQLGRPVSELGDSQHRPGVNRRPLVDVPAAEVPRVNAPEDDERPRDQRRERPRDGEREQKDRGERDPGDHQAVRIRGEHERRADAGCAEYCRERGDYTREYLA